MNKFMIQVCHPLAVTDMSCCLELPFEYFTSQALQSILEKYFKEHRKHKKYSIIVREFNELKDACLDMFDDITTVFTWLDNVVLHRYVYEKIESAGMFPYKAFYLGEELMVVAQFYPQRCCTYFHLIPTRKDVKVICGESMSKFLGPVCEVIKNGCFMLPGKWLFEIAKREQNRNLWVPKYLKKDVIKTEKRLVTI